MNNAMITILVLFFTAAAASGQSLERFKTLSGCWEGKNTDRLYQEYWMEPADDMMLGMSRTVKAGKTITYEFVRIQKREDGTYYIAKPIGQMKAEFKMTSFDNQQAVFENSAHDFPQKIVYHFTGKDSLKAWIEGKSKKGESKKREFTMTRAKCPEGK